MSDALHVDFRLQQLGLTRQLLSTAAHEGDLARRSVPPFAYPGHDEYAAGSQTRSSICEHGGTTDGGWHAGTHLGIPVAFNHSETIAVHPTGGSEGTGKVDGEPFNKSPKGPQSKRASSGVVQAKLDADGMDDEPVDFWWYFSMRNDAGLWAELFSPIFEDGGIAIGWSERILLGNLGRGDEVLFRRQPDAPVAPPELNIARKPAS